MNLLSKPQQAPQVLEVLRAKVAELEAKLSKRDQLPPELPVSSSGVPGILALPLSQFPGRATLATAAPRVS
jgi:hypothetical protein